MKTAKEQKRKTVLTRLKFTKRGVSGSGGFIRLFRRKIRIEEESTAQQSKRKGNARERRNEKKKGASLELVAAGIEIKNTGRWKGHL